MKKLLLLLLVFITTTTIAQIDTGDCRAKVTFIGYNNGKYTIEITNKTECITSYSPRDPQNNLSVDTFHVRGKRSRIVEFAAPLSCGRVSILPNEFCRNDGMTCKLDYVYSREVCSVLPVQSFSFFPTQQGNYLSGTIGLNIDPKSTDIYEVEMILDNGKIITKPIQPIKKEGQIYIYNTKIN